MSRWSSTSELKPERSEGRLLERDVDDRSLWRGMSARPIRARVERGVHGLERTATATREEGRYWVRW